MAGVGSSTAAVNLTRAFTSQDKHVGRVDIEVWGYSAPQMP
jgi:Mrp family chromosome partitioning ATPase